ncbi:MAG: hypothetical protein WBP64_18140 [Nitrososphaeraceae archaeon]
MQSIEQISDLTCHKISPNADKRCNRLFLDEYSVIDNKLLMTITSIINTWLIILTLGIDVDNSSALAKKYKILTVQQVNDCRNYQLSTNVTCSNSDLNSEQQESINNFTIVYHSFLPFP